MTDFGNNLVKLTDARGNAYLFTYDVWGHKTAMIYPDGSHENWTYDAAGNVLTYTTRAGQVKTSTYDNLNRLTAIDWSDSTPDVTMTYDAVGRLLTMNNGVSALSYAYNDANQLTSETQNIAGAAGPAVVGYSYNADGTRASLTYPDGHVVSYAYTSRNQLSTINVDGAAPLVAYGYDADGKPATKTLENGTSTTYSYDDAERLTEVKHVRDTTVLAQFDYALDAVGNRTQKAINGAIPNRTENYGYDPVDQLTSADYGPSNETFEYDEVANRISVADSLNGTTGYSANNVNQYTGVGATTPVYDSNGNLATYASSTYTYDAGNRLLTAADGPTNAAFAYDAINRQVSRMINGSTLYLIYDGWNLIAEYDSSGVLEAKYIHGARVDEILAKIDASGTAVYYHHDALGSTAALSSAAGVVLESYHYDTFGKPTVYDSSGSSIGETAHGNRFLFSGREYIAELKLYDYRNRVYSPELGRFLQTDPLRFGAGDANVYRYVGNNAGNATDPTGLYTPDDSGLFAGSDAFSAGGDCDSGSGFDLTIGTGIADPLPTFDANLPPLEYSGQLRVDTDGTLTTNFFGEEDPTYNTSAWRDADGNLVPRGQGMFPLNANTDVYGVVPAGANSPGMFQMGDQMTIRNNNTGVVETMQVGDGGPFPTRRNPAWGETSVAGVGPLGGTVVQTDYGPAIAGPTIPVTVTVSPGTYSTPSRGTFYVPPFQLQVVPPKP